MPRTREQYEEIKSARKQEILNSAVRIFCEKGYDNAKIDDIMKDCGCSHGLMYHYFKNKDEIFCDILNTAARHSNELYERDLSERKFTRESFEQMVRHFLKHLRDDKDFAYFIHFMSTLHMIRHDFDFRSVPTPFDQSVRPLPFVRNLFVEGQQDGFIRTDDDPKALATLFGAIFQGLAYQKVFAMGQGMDACIPSASVIFSLFLTQS